MFIDPSVKTRCSNFFWICSLAIDVDWFAEDDVAEAAGKYSIIDVNESDLDFTVFIYSLAT